MAEKKISDFEPAIIKEVRKSGDIYVGRQHSGKTAYVYFLRKEEEEQDGTI